MEQKLLDLIPSRFLCPYCGKWHKWTKKHELGYYDSKNYKAELECSNLPVQGNYYSIYFLEGYCFYSTDYICNRANQSIKGKIPLSSIVESADKPTVTFEVGFTAESDVGKYECSFCEFKDECIYLKLGDEGDNRHMTITFGFEFEESDYNKFAKVAVLTRKESELQEREQAINDREQAVKAREDAVASKEQVSQRSQVTENKEDTTMKKTNATPKTTLKQQLYEHSPKENVELIKQFANKYKPVLKWAVPVASIYAAYRILNSDKFGLSINNISNVCEERLGFTLDSLEDKTGLKELLVIGGVCAGAYGAVKAVSTIYSSSSDSDEDIAMEDVEDGMNRLEGISKKFSWLTPKTEKLLPIALSVITVFVMTQKPWKIENKFTNKIRALTSDWTFKVNVYSEMVNLFIKDKFNIDLSNEDEQQKIKIFAFLAAIVGISLFLYGRKVLGEKAASDEESENENPENNILSGFVSQVLPIMKKLAPSVFSVIVTAMVSKKLLSADTIDDSLIIDESFVGAIPPEDLADAHENETEENEEAN